jgi:hypothetical protein
MNNKRASSNGDNIAVTRGGNNEIIQWGRGLNNLIFGWWNRVGQAGGRHGNVTEGHYNSTFQHGYNHDSETRASDTKAAQFGHYETTRVREDGREVTEGEPPAWWHWDLFGDLFRTFRRRFLNWPGFRNLFREVFGYRFS